MVPHAENLTTAEAVASPQHGLPRMRNLSESANDSADGSGRSNRAATLIAWLMGSSAVSYYLSILIHLLAYGGAAILFVALGYSVVEPEVDVAPLRASLDDFDKEDDKVKFETITEISMGKMSGDSDIQNLASNLTAVENGLLKTFNDDSLTSFLKNDDDEGLDGDGFLFKLPESGLAVTKGSFTAWTEPEHPKPREPYLIIIEVRLKNKIRKYRVNDLSGMVLGSDRYRQKIPYDARTPDASFYTDEAQKMQKMTGSEQIKVRNNKVQLAIRVPGARQLVRDTIQVKSRRLRETQTIQLVFGKR